MKCIVNGESKNLPDGLTVEGLIEHLGLASAICAAEVDKKIVPKRERSSCILIEGQQVEIVTLVGGG
ncbi:MAG: sulfur carrier protein ThiS [Phycisphaerales bacterium]|nr:sulfur carrier protein ThiS [Phycisphaerales bacterium]